MPRRADRPASTNTLTVKDFIIRWREAIAKIESPDPDERLLARATVAQEFRRVIDAIVLHDDRHISVRVKKGQCDGNQLEYVVSRDTVERLRLTLADGQIVQVTNQQRRTRPANSYAACSHR